MAPGASRNWSPRCVSNFDVSELDEALSIAGPKKIACNQVLYNLEQRDVEHEVVPWCEKHGVAVVCYTRFGRGRKASNAEHVKENAGAAKSS